MGANSMIDFVNTVNRPAMPSRMRIVQMCGVTRTYQMGETQVLALQAIDLEIFSGEMVAVWGPSGSGKSTLMNVIGLIDRPDAGTLLFDGIDVLSASDDDLSDYRARHLGFVFQSFNLVPVLTVLENVALPLDLLGVPKAEAMERAQTLLATVGLGRHLSFRPDRLSGGQRQRTAIARALVCGPKLVIADEPTASLDSENSQNVIDLMRDLNVKTGTTFVFATHDPRLLEQIPRTVYVKDGRIDLARESHA